MNDDVKLGSENFNENMSRPSIRRHVVRSTANLAATKTHAMQCKRCFSFMNDIFEKMSQKREKAEKRTEDQSFPT